MGLVNENAIQEAKDGGYTYRALEEMERLTTHVANLAARASEFGGRGL